MFKHPKPCKICNGKQKTRCMICGWTKMKGDRAQRKQITRSERRQDYLGSLYNSMRKYQMQTTGLLADCEGMTGLLIEKFVADIAFVIVDDGVIVEVPISDLQNIRQNDIDLQVMVHIGNPTIPDAPIYTPLYKNRKNEV